MCWKTIIGPGDRTYIENIGRLSARWLASFTFSYINLQSVGAVISTYIEDNFWKTKIPDKQKRTDVATYAILHISRHWFDYKLPKWLIVVSNLQEYVFKKHNMKHGNYTYLASNIENGFLPPKFAALTEYGIPISAIKKLKNLIDPDKTPESNIALINRLTDAELEKQGLLSYEIEKLQNAI